MGLVTELIKFLRARLDEDEQDAMAAKAEPHPLDGIGPGGASIAFTPRGWLAEQWNPDRVLREIEAKRDVLSRHARGTSGWNKGDCTGCGWTGDKDDPMTGPDEHCPEHLSMALPYSDHPDFREEWRP